jgi:hypothetical protein
VCVEGGAIWGVAAGERERRSVWRLAEAASWRRGAPVCGRILEVAAGQISGGSEEEKLLQLVLDSLVAGTSHSEHVTVTIYLRFMIRFFNTGNIWLHSNTRLFTLLHYSFHIGDRAGRFSTGTSFCLFNILSVH